MLSIKEISLRTGFSTATVSRALDPRQNGKVKPETREQILRFCDKLQYQPKFSAQALASGRTCTIGLVSCDVESMLMSPTLSQFIAALTAALKADNYMLSILPICDSDEAAIERDIIQTFRSSRVDGFVLETGVVHESLVETLRKENYPVVMFSMPSEVHSVGIGVDYVSVDNSNAYRQLVRMLREEKRRCAYLRSFRSMRYSLRSELFGKIAREEGLTFGEQDFFDVEFSVPVEQMYITYRWILAHWESVSFYDAWVVANDQMALGALEALRSKKLTPGKDILVAGYDDLQNSRGYIGEANLTSIRPPFGDMGAECARLLLEQIGQRRDSVRHVLLESQLILRESTGKIPLNKLKG